MTWAAGGAQHAKLFGEGLATRKTHADRGGGGGSRGDQAGVCGGLWGHFRRLLLAGLAWRRHCKFTFVAACSLLPSEPKGRGALLHAGTGPSSLLTCDWAHWGRLADVESRVAGPPGRRVIPRLALLFRAGPDAHEVHAGLEDCERVSLTTPASRTTADPAVWR
ncbi:hypothetical protein NDU88_002345 [Pleurodeles waltl]|uniref:Uncharacterized protein n=1 Tax=Pleurodeles waltl TaxID=8319 RepID=A0AAV7VEM2_PLEWA|nr:hypothetical protein NDU88_002345 [Pleurodeles waltl]